MKNIYGIYSRRGIYTERTKEGEKKVTLYGKERAQEAANGLTTLHKRRYWVECVDVKILSPFV